MKIGLASIGRALEGFARRARSRFRPARCAGAGFALIFALPAGAGQSLYFGDPGGTVEVDGSVWPADAAQWTLECRIKILAPGKGAVRLLSQWDDSNEPGGGEDRGRFHLGLGPPGQVVLSLRAASGAVHTLSGSLPQDARWHHLAATWKEGVASVFVDGKAVATQTVAGAAGLAASKLPLVIGPPAAKKGARPVFFEGFIGDVAFWKIARDAASIAQGGGQSLTGNEAGLLACYPLQGGAGRVSLAGLPPGRPDGRLTGALARVGWVDTPRWDDPQPDRPWLHLFRYDLTAVPQIMKEPERITPFSGKALGPKENPEVKEAALPVIKGNVRRLVANDKTQQPGVLWQDPASKRVYVAWVDGDFAGLQGAALPVLERADLVAGTWGPGGRLYYLMIESLPGNHPETQPPKALLRHVSPAGSPLHETALDTAALSYYAGWGRGNMAFASDTVHLLMPRILCNGNPTGEGVHHQASLAVSFPADLKEVRSSGNPSSHSFGTILAATSSRDAMGLELGDCFPRALQLHKFTKEKRVSKIIFNYKANLITIEKDGRPLKVSHDADTYTELGGVAEGAVSYSVIIATDRSPAGQVLDYSRVGIPNEPRNLALLRIAKNFEGIPGGYDVNDALIVPGRPVPAPLETGEFHVFTGELCRQRNPGVVWLTNYGPGEAAHAPHILRRRDGGILVVWEKTGGADGGPSLWAMVVHESGRRIVEPVRLGIDLELEREDPVIRIGSRDCLLARDRRSSKLQLCWFLETPEYELEPWAGPRGWGPDNPEYQREMRELITAPLRKQLDAINAVADRIDKLELLNAFLAGDRLSAADPSLTREAREGLAELLKDPAVRREQEAAAKYQMIADLERKAGRDRNKRISVAMAYRDLSDYYKDTRAGKKASADFERMKKDL